MRGKPVHPTTWGLLARALLFPGMQEVRARLRPHATEAFRSWCAYLMLLELSARSRNAVRGACCTTNLFFSVPLLRAGCTGIMHAHVCWLTRGTLAQNAYSYWYNICFLLLIFEPAESCSCLPSSRISGVYRCRSTVEVLRIRKACSTSTVSLVAQQQYQVIMHHPRNRLPTAVV